jgi:exonuclease III
MQPQNKLLTLLTWNANSIYNKSAELLHFIATHNITVAMISETHLIPSLSLKVANSRVYRTDRAGTSRSGGTAIIVDSNHEHHELTLPTSNSIEATGIQLKTKSGPLRVISVYCRPGIKFAQEDLNRLMDSPHPTIIGGDLNAKHDSWNARVTNTRGRALYSMSRKMGFTVAGPTEPTHYSNGLGDILDIFILKDINLSFELETVVALSSDHNPVIMRLGDEAVSIQPVPRFNYRKTDWRQFQTVLAPNIETAPITTTAELDDAVEKLTAAILVAREASTPLADKSRCSIFDFPPSLQIAIREKNRMRRLWQRHRTLDLKMQYKHLEKRTHQLVLQHRAEKWEDAVSQLEPSSKSLWAMSRRLTKKTVHCPPIQGRHHLACSPRDKAEALADSLELQFTPNPSTPDSARVEAAVENFLSLHTAESAKDGVIPVTRDEILGYVTKLDNNKAPGLDGITNQMLKMLPGEAGTRLVEIINAVFDLQHFPTPWKVAKVIVFPKPGKNLRDPTSYRPISLLVTMAKICEKAGNTRYGWHIEANNILPNEQFGFRERHSTTQQLLRVTDQITDSFNKKSYTGIVFLDVAKAYDRVWHDGLICKLIDLDFPTYLINFTQSYLSNRSFSVYLETASSTFRPILAGVPQGSIIGPVLFNLFTHDIPTTLPNVQLAMYADDVAVIAESLSPLALGKYLQPALDTLCQWYRSNRMTLNTGKTTATLFTRLRRDLTPPDITLDGEPVSWSPTSLYLGVLLDSKLIWKAHVERIAEIANKKVCALHPLLRSNSMPLASKAQLIYTIIVPSLTYACPVWSGCALTTRRILQRVQNRALRTALGEPFYTRTVAIHNTMDFPLVDESLRRLNAAFYEKIKEGHTNPLIDALAGMTEGPHDRHPRPFHALYI